MAQWKKKKKRDENDKVQSQNPWDCTFVYLSSPFPGKQLFSPDWTPAWTGSFHDPAHSDTAREQRWGEQSGIFKATIQEAESESVTFPSVTDHTLVMAGRLHHIMFSGWICLYLKLFFAPVSGSIDNKRKLRATPQWRYLKRETGFRPGKHVFVCACVHYVCQHSAEGVVWCWSITSAG